eukprot:gnl/Chilomastix_caulleri/1041.p1 GENE.gnl/Chilomastix_caulleri/1041~~gnl/Chilomastix_caulleri/1041.p1  ORF type:complete len:226 (+),score=62.52 gnl/Chilomastix_caulleri/1041:56-733(+)
MPLIILIEGNIAAGKSTLAKELCVRLDLKLFEEPVEDNPYLVDFYANPAKFAAKMQSWFLNLRFRTYMEALAYSEETGRGVVLDRSVWSDCVFADNCHNDGLMTDEEYEAYWVERMNLLTGLRKPDLCIYLEASPEVCLERITKVRGRECEQSIPIGYLRGLDGSYIRWLQRMKELGVEVLNVNRNTFAPAVNQRVYEKVMGMTSSKQQDDNQMPSTFTSFIFEE